MSYLQTNYHFNSYFQNYYFNSYFQKVDQHTGGSWLIHATKHLKHNRCKARNFVWFWIENKSRISLSRLLWILPRLLFLC